MVYLFFEILGVRMKKVFIFFVLLLGGERISAETWSSQVVENNVMVTGFDFDLAGYFGPWASINDQGVAILKWQEGDFNNGLLKSVYSLDGGINWSPVHSFNTAGAFPYIDSFYQPLSVNAQGKAVLSWLEQSTGFVVKASFFSPSTGWGPSQEVSTGMMNAAYTNENSAIGNNGIAVVVWGDGATEQIKSAFYDEGSSTWTEKVIYGEPGLAALPLIGISPSGALLISGWITDSAGMVQVFASVYDGSAWGPRQLLATVPSGHFLAQSVFLAVSDSGTAVFFYGINDSMIMTQKFYASVYKGSSWEPAVVIDQAVSPNSLVIVPQMLSINQQGHAALFWLVEDAMMQQSAYSSFYDGSGWQPPSLIVANLSAAMGDASGAIALDDSDTAFAVVSGLGNNPIGAVRKLSPSDSWSNTILDDSLFTFASPNVFINNAGGALTGWLSADMMTMSLNARSAIYSSGTWMTNTFSPSATMFNFFFYPRGALASNNALLCWGQEGSNLLYSATTQVSFGPASPTDGRGYQASSTFLVPTDLINVLSWNPSSTSDVSYRIYREGTLVGTSYEPHYDDHQRVPGKSVLYSITAVTASGTESAPLSFRVNP